jgi:hypothetical protein
MAKGRPKSPRPGRRGYVVLSNPADRSLLLDLIVEMQHIAQDIAARSGVTQAEERAARERAARTKSRSRPSARLMAQINGAGDVLSTWRRDPRYQSSGGAPRVLKIKGKGKTLESLVRECCPKLAVSEVVDYICSHGEAQRYKRDHVALLGSAAVLTQRTSEVTLAWLLTQIRHLAETSLWNASIPAARVKGVGLFQRVVTGYLSDANFKRYAMNAHPRLQLLCEQLEAGLALGRRAKGRSSRKECGVVLSLYRDSGSIG